jgi:hypothetical protein
LLAAFTARTTRVSNPDRSPGFRPSPSDPFWSDAFAIGGLLRIIPFYRSPQHTSDSSRSLVWQCSLHAVQLSCTISQRIYQTGYERFRPNNRDCHLWRRYYRGGWHRSCPPLIRQDTYSWQKPKQSLSTESSPITLSCIVEVSRLLHPVGLEPVFQCSSPGYHSHGPYRSLAWWAITPPTT